MKPCNYLIIGASSGIGKELAHQLAQKGHYIYATFNKNKVKKTTDQIANTATFLLSKQNSWITGQILHVDGGLSSLRV